MGKERQELTPSRKLNFLGKAVRLRLKEMTIGFRYPFDLAVQTKESLVVELEREELLDEAKNEETLARLGLHPQRK